MILYKYFDMESGLRILSNLRIYFTPPKYFNDINEMSPFINKEITQEEYLKYFCHDVFLQPEYEYRKSIRSYEGSYSEFVEQARTDEEIIISIRQRIRRAYDSLERKFKKKMSEYVGVCCMSKIATSNLMWAHYANSHKGICIGFSFDVSEIVLINNKAIDYLNVKVHLPSHFITLSDKDRYPYYEEISFSKGDEWSYEREHRLLANLEDCKKEERGSEIYYYQDIDKTDVKCVILGIQCDLENVIRNIVKKRIKAPIMRCVQEGDSFSIKMEETT